MAYIFMSSLPDYIYAHTQHTHTHFYVNEIILITLLHYLLFKFKISVIFAVSYPNSCMIFYNVDVPALLY